MMMLVVVPGKEVLAETTGILDGTEAIRVIGPVFHGFEVRFGERIVVRDMGTTVGFDDTEGGQQKGQ
jgi:hypothetical protein